MQDIALILKDVGCDDRENVLIVVEAEAPTQYWRTN
jgi:hypothetical protein